MSKNLTLRQREILDFIKNYYESNNFPPSINEISTYFKISVKASYDHINALKKKGFISYESGKKRAIRLTDRIYTEQDYCDIDSDAIPILGIVQAGMPIVAYEDSSNYIRIDRGFFGSSALFALKIRGDSMIDAGIFEGDIAIIKADSSFENGEIVVVETENGVTIKRAYKELNRLRLEACNSNYDDILTTSPRIIGRLVGLIRKY